MENLSLEKIELLLNLFKWLMGGVAILLVIIARFIWGIYKGINTISAANGVRDEKVKRLRTDHDKLSEFVYQKN